MLLLVTHVLFSATTCYSAELWDSKGTWIRKFRYTIKYFFSLYFGVGYVFEAMDHTHNRRVALKRIEKVGTQLSREYEILFELRDCENVIKILVY